MRPLRRHRVAAAICMLAAFMTACAEAPGPTPELGPHDGAELPDVEPERVAVGDTAPDFSLRAHDGEIVTLSDFHGNRDILLVFYRGHW
jgi:cytochrome oxidase Cu insertion factor (SCO1/SenC/PrrC family)